MQDQRRGPTPPHPQGPAEIDGVIADQVDTLGSTLKRAGIPPAPRAATTAIDALNVVNSVWARSGASPTMTKPMLRGALAVVWDRDRRARGLIRQAARGNREAIVQILADTLGNFHLLRESDPTDPVAWSARWCSTAKRCTSEIRTRRRTGIRSRGHRSRRTTTRSSARSGDSGSGEPGGDDPAGGLALARWDQIGGKR